MPASKTADQETKIFLPVCKGLKMNSRSRVGPIQDVCRTLLRTAASSVGPARCACGPLDARPAGRRHFRARTAVSASETTKQDFPSGLEDPQDGQRFDVFFQGSVQEVCWMTSTPPPLRH